MNNRNNTRISDGKLRVSFRRLLYLSLFGSLVILCSVAITQKATLSNVSGTRFSRIIKLLQDRQLKESQQHQFWKRTTPAIQDSFENVREIYVGKIVREGIGAVVSNFRPVLQLAHETGALIVGKDARSPHGYQLTEYIKMGKSHPNRKNCKLTENIYDILINISKQCTKYDFNSLQGIGLFNNCNTVIIPVLPTLKPRTCLKKTIPLVHNFLQPILQIAPKSNSRTDVCVVRRGGDMEHRIAIGIANYTAIDELHTLPILQALKKMGAKIVLITQTKREKAVLQKYNPNIFSNQEPLPLAFGRLSNCRCMFIAAASSFAFLATIISSPSFIVHTVPRPDFEFRFQPYDYQEFGERAISIRSNSSKIVEKCLVPSKTSFFRNLF